MKKEKPYRWKTLIAAYSASFTFALTLQSVPPVLNLLIQEFRLTYAEAGLTMSLFGLPMVFFSIPAGVIADRYGPRMVGLAAFILTLAGTQVVAFSTGLPMLLAGRALTGMGAFTLIVIAPQILSQWFIGKELGTAMGIWNTAFPLGTVISFLTLGSIAQALGWQGPIMISAGITVMSMILFMLLAEPAPSFGGQAASYRLGASAIFRAGLPIWLVGLAWLFFNGSTLSFMAFAPQYFQSTGYSVGMAGLLSSTMLLGSLLISPLVGLLLNRGLRKEALIIAGALGLALGLFAIPVNPSIVVPLLILLAIGNSLVVVPAFALPAALLPASTLGLGYGILATCLNIGIVLGPLLGGLAKDLTGTYVTSLWAMAIMALLISVTTVPLYGFPKTATLPAASPK